MIAAVHKDTVDKLHPQAEERYFAQFFLCEIAGNTGEFIINGDNIKHALVV